MIKCLDPVVIYAIEFPYAWFAEINLDLSIEAPSAIGAIGTQCLLDAQGEET